MNEPHACKYLSYIDEHHLSTQRNVKEIFYTIKHHVEQRALIFAWNIGIFFFSQWERYTLNVNSLKTSLKATHMKWNEKFVSCFHCARVENETTFWSNVLLQCCTLRVWSHEVWFMKFFRETLTSKSIAQIITNWRTVDFPFDKSSYNKNVFSTYR